MSTGRPRTFLNEDVLKAIDEHEEPVVTLTDLAEVMDPSREAINPRLKELVESGKLNRKRAGASAVVYWKSCDHQLVSSAE